MISFLCRQFMASFICIFQLTGSLVSVFLRKTHDKSVMLTSVTQQCQCNLFHTAHCNQLKLFSLFHYLYATYGTLLLLWIWKQEKTVLDYRNLCIRYLLEISFIQITCSCLCIACIKNIMENMSITIQKAIQNAQSLLKFI